MFFQKFLNAKMAEVVKRGSDGIMVPVPPRKRHQTFSQIPGKPPSDLVRQLVANMHRSPKRDSMRASDFLHPAFSFVA